jgi:chitinase
MPRLTRLKNTWSTNWDASNGNSFSGTVGPHLDTLP